jgi:5-methylcytosine-specific restriction endonuclease McrA
MTTITPSALGQVSDRDLLTQVQLAAQAERRATAHLIALLMELDVRRLYLGEGCSSLFTYCTQVLHFAEHAAYNRIEAARAARRYPVILELLEAGAVTLTTVRLLAPHLTPENHREVLECARHKSKRDVELLVAGLSPGPDVPPMVRKLPTPAAGAAPKPGTAEQQRAANDGVPASVASLSGFREKRPAELKPLAPERYKIQVTVCRETYEKLRRAQDLLRHTVPDGDPAIIFDRALSLLVTELERTKIGTTDRPRAVRRANATSRHIPAAIRRTIWQRDGGRCAFMGANGRCTETGFLEYHHVVPFAAGGETSARNLELRCRAHNQYEADQYFGPGHMPLLREQRAVYETWSNSFRDDLRQTFKG